MSANKRIKLETGQTLTTRDPILFLKSRWIYHEHLVDVSLPYSRIALHELFLVFQLQIGGYQYKLAALFQVELLPEKFSKSNRVESLQTQSLLFSLSTTWVETLLFSSHFLSPLFNCSVETQDHFTYSF